MGLFYVGQVDIIRPLYFAIDGTNWALLRTHFPEVVGTLASKCLVFARMSPNQKTQLIEILQSMDYITAMVGDGANDCGVSLILNLHYIPNL